MTLDELVEAWEPKVRAAFLAAVYDLRASIDINALTARLEAGDVHGAMETLGIKPARFRGLEIALIGAFEASAVWATDFIVKTTRFRALVFDIREFQTDFWLRSHTREVVEAIVQDQREMASSIIRDGLGTIQPRALAFEIVGKRHPMTGRRENAFLGLTNQQAGWVRNYESEIGGATPSRAALDRKLRDKRWDRSVEAAIRDKRPISAATQEKMAAAYKNRALRSRADLIASKEADQAAIKGQDDAYRQAQASGALDGFGVRRFWATVGDDHVRPTHRAVPGMNPNGVAFDQPFQTPKGPAMNPGWDFDPGCRCRVRMKVRLLPTSALAA